VKPPALSLNDLETYDPDGGRERHSNRRWLCPHCGHTKPRDRAHRSLIANVESGLWNCQRCKTGGKLRDFWEERPTPDRRTHQATALRRAFELPPTPAPSTTAGDETWHDQLPTMRPLADTPGAVYMSGRGIPYDLAHAAGVRYTPGWAPRNAENGCYKAGPAVVFPMRDQAGKLVAANGRYIHAAAKPKTRTGGDAREGVFATPGAWKMDTFIIVEGPIDALSMAHAGYPAIAVVGCTLPLWLPRACAFKRVLIASDADPSGDAAAGEWKRQLGPFATHCERLLPKGAKDWNELLQAIGRDVLADLLAEPVMMEARALQSLEMHGGGAAFEDEE
jgi:hypothetical protein